MIVLLLVSLAFPALSPAVNFYTGGRLAEGFYLNLYPYWYSADRQTGNDGKAIINNLGLTKYGVLIGGSYYIGNLLLNVNIPVGGATISLVGEDDAGLGDVQLRAGYFLPIKVVTILPALAVKAPTGSYDSHNKVNLGDGQTDILAEVYLNKIFTRFAVDALLKYSKRLRNGDTNSTPGNEFAAEGLVTYKFCDDFRLGPSASFVVGDDNKKGGLTAGNSGLMKLAAGAELAYRGFERAKISFVVLQDVYSRNTAEGTLVTGRINLPF